MNDSRNSKLISYLSVSILLIAFYSILTFPNAVGLKIVRFVDITFIWWIIIAIIYFITIVCIKKYYDKRHNKLLIPVFLFLIWVLFSTIRGCFIAETYWDWKGLTANALALFLTVNVLLATNEKILQLLLSTYFKYVFGLFFVALIFFLPQSFGNYLMPFSFIIIFLPVLTYNWKWVVLFFTIIVLTASFGARSNVIKFAVPLALLIIYYARHIIQFRILNLVRMSFMLLPVMFFSLGALGVFNIFDMDDYIENINLTVIESDGRGNKLEGSVKDDTRTFIYEEVLTSANRLNSWVIGRSPARGNISEAFGQDDLNKRNERNGNEVAIANIFTWTGIVGVILYFLIFYQASYLAINRSKNIFVKMLGIFIAFRWAYSWVEDMNNFSLNYYMLWMMIGLCFSVSFRAMTNKEVTIWVRGIFDIQYRWYEYQLKQKNNDAKGFKNSSFTNLP